MMCNDGNGGYFQKLNILIRRLVLNVDCPNDGSQMASVRHVTEEVAGISAAKRLDQKR